MYKDENFFYDPCFIGNVVVTTTKWRHCVFYVPLYFSVLGFFFSKRLRELVPPLVASIMAKFEQIRFGNILKRSFKGHKNGE